MKQLLVDPEAFRPGELHITGQQQVEAVEALGDDGAQLGGQILVVTLKVHLVVEKDLLNVVALVGVAQQVVGGHVEVIRQPADRIEVRLLALGLVAGDGGTLFVD